MNPLRSHGPSNCRSLGPRPASDITGPAARSNGSLTAVQSLGASSPPPIFTATVGILTTVLRTSKTLPFLNNHQKQSCQLTWIIIFTGPELIKNHFYAIRILLLHAHSNSTPPILHIIVPLVLLQFFLISFSALVTVFQKLQFLSNNCLHNVQANHFPSGPQGPQHLYASIPIRCLFVLSPLALCSSPLVLYPPYQRPQEVSQEWLPGIRYNQSPPGRLR